jgi:cell division protein FtsB
MLIELVLIVLGVIVGYNVRRERQMRKENLALDQVDARVRRELEVALNLNDSLRQDVAELKARLAMLKKAA